MSTLEKVLAQFEKNKQTSGGSGNKVSQEEREKKYFTTVLPKGVRQAEKRIRILPTKDGESPFVEVRFHEILVDGKWLKLYDPAQEGKRSPLNEVLEGLLSTGKKEDKELAKSYRTKLFYIVKVIDRDNEQDGVKFWRFKDSYKGDGVFDKIFPIIQKKKEIWNENTGRDLTLYLTLTKANNGKEYTTVTTIMAEDASPLHTDKKVAEGWVMDELVWSDVYAKRGEDYLDMVAKGETPKWDSNLSKWVSKTTAEETIGNTTVTTSDPQQDDDTDEDLPF